MKHNPQILVSYSAHEIGAAIERFRNLAKQYPGLARQERDLIARCADELSDMAALVSDTREAAE